MVSTTATFMTSVPSADSGLASGLHNTARQLGGAIRIAGLVALAQAMSGSAGAGQSIFPGKLVGLHAAFIVAGIVGLALACMAMLLAGDEEHY